MYDEMYVTFNKYMPTTKLKMRLFQVLTKIVESKALEDAGQSINITNVVALTEGYSISDLGDFVANVRYAAALRSLREGTANSDKQVSSDVHTPL